jgi:hypothetical protein
VTEGSPPSPFSANKQNEPAVAIDQQHPNILAAGANDNIDMEACNAGTDNTCPFTEGVGVSGISFSTDSGASWTQPTYTGLSARNCVGAIGDNDPPCEPKTGPIGTLPNYDTNDLVSDGDPALAFGRATSDDGSFSKTESRLYYANLTAALPGAAPFKGPEAIAGLPHGRHPRSDRGRQRAWSEPVIASRQSGAQFSDKEQVWADNAQSSPFFGNAYVCYAAFRGNGSGNQPLDVLVSRNGGDSWTQHQVTAATNNTHSRNGFGRSGCTVRTDSRGVVYVFDFQFGFSATTAAPGQIQMIKSTDGGSHWSRPVNIFRAFDTCNAFEPSIGRCVEDGVGGARSDLSPAPSVDIATGADGAGATDRMVISWVDGRDGINTRARDVQPVAARRHGLEHPGAGRAARTRSAATRRTIAATTRRRRSRRTARTCISSTTRSTRRTGRARSGPGNDRKLVGVVLQADWPGTTFSEIHRGEPGDARGSSQNDLAAEFLGDYVYAAATNDYGAAVWNDVRNAADCDAVRPPPAGAPRRGAGDRRADRGGGGAPRRARAGRDHGGRRRRARCPAGVPGDVRELGHLRRRVRRPDAVSRPLGGARGCGRPGRGGYPDRWRVRGGATGGCDLPGA